MHSDYFFKGTVKKVPSDRAYVAAAHQFAATLLAIDESTLVRTSDGVDLIWFTKRGMFSPYGALWEIFYSLSMAVIMTLLQMPKSASTEFMYAPQHPWFTILLTNMVQHFAYW